MFSVIHSSSGDMIFAKHIPFLQPFLPLLLHHAQCLLAAWDKSHLEWLRRCKGSRLEGSVKVHVHCRCLRSIFKQRWPHLKGPQEVHQANVQCVFAELCARADASSGTECYIPLR